MYDYPRDPTGGPGPFGYPSGSAGSPPASRHSILRVILGILAIALLGAMALGAVSWAAGLLLDLVGLLVRVAIVTAVVAFVWRRVRSGRCRGN